jgi:hypothetical protein
MHRTAGIVVSFQLSAISFQLNPRYSRGFSNHRLVKLRFVTAAGSTSIELKADG